MTDTTARFAEPISASAPCGVDLADDPALFEIERLARGRPSTQFSEGEKPDWNALRQLCENTLARSKHLTALVYYILALVETEGIAGEADGLELLRAVLERYWGELFPALDPSDANDPTRRINILSSLTNPIGSYEDPFRFVECVRRLPLFTVPRIGAVSLESLSHPAGDGAPGIDANQLGGMLSELKEGELIRSKIFLDRSMQALLGIASFLERTVGIAAAPSWQILIDTLTEQMGILNKGGASASSQIDRASANMPDNFGAPATAGEKIGLVQSRDDVVRAISAICNYYQRYEPSSPVPFLLKRAESLVTKNFLDVIADLAPEASNQVKIVTGVSGG